MSSSRRGTDERRTRGGSLDSLEDDNVEEEEYEVDVGPLQERLDQNGGGEVSMRREAGREDDWKGHLIGSDGKRSGTIPLEPYRHQVGGHNHIFRFSKKAVCKVRTLFRLACIDHELTELEMLRTASHFERKSIL
jgi:hypothetical protein